MSVSVKHVYTSPVRHFDSKLWKALLYACLPSPRTVSNIHDVTCTRSFFEYSGKVACIIDARYSKNGANICAIARPSEDRCAVKEELLVIRPFHLIFKHMVKK